MVIPGRFPAYAAIVLLLTLVSTATAKYSGGSGAAQDPYKIATAADLIALGETPADYDKHFILTADIDLDPNLPGRKVFDKAVIASDTDPSEYSGFNGTPFTGVFDGRDHMISHVTIRGKDYVGLVGRMWWSATLKNLGVVDVNIAGSGNFIGGLVGDNVQGAVTQCYSTGAVSGGWHVGGLVGLNDWRTGPLYIYRATVTQCYSTVAVSGGDEVGGLVGTNARSTVNQCYSSGGVTGTGQNLGGLVGWNYGGTVIQCYSTGTVAGSGQYIGGLVGQNSRDVLQSFWDLETSGQSTSDGGTGKTTAEMQTAKTFLDAGWDFVGETANGTEDIWKIVEGQTYPLLSWQKYSGGTGEPNDPYQVGTAADLISLGEDANDYDKHFILTADIDLDPNLPGRKVFDGAVIGTFTGVFDGNGHTISHLTIVGGEHLGLFGLCGAWRVPPLHWEVRDLGVVDVSIVGSGRCVAGLVGYKLGGRVIECYSTGVVRGSEDVGGLIGWNHYFGTVTQCYSTCAVTGTSSCIGGLVGKNGEFVGRQAPGGIYDSYSTGSVSGTSVLIGGLVGRNDYGIVESCFWNTETSGQATSDGGTGKTTAEMQAAKAFLDAGWDFVGETTNGTEDIWWINEGKDYPRLWWERNPED